MMSILFRRLRHVISALLILLVGAHGAWAAIAYDNSGGFTNNPATNTATVALTVTATANTVLYVGVTYNAASITSVAFNGVNATLVPSCAGSSNPIAPHTGFASSLALYSLIAPASGTHNIVVTASGNGFILLAAETLSGANQATNPDVCASTTTNLGAATITGTVTTLVGNSWVVMYGGTTANGPPTVNAGGVIRADDQFAGGGLTAIYDTNGPVASPSASSIVLNSPASQAASAITVSVPPPTAAVANGIATLISVTKTTATLAVGNASGGTAPYTYQWYRSATGGFTPGGGNIIGGATSQSLTDTPPTPGTWFYQNVTTDSAGSPATSTSNQVGVTQYTGTNVSILACCDSLFSGYLNNGSDPTNTLGNDPITFASLMLAAQTKTRWVVFFNAAYAGTYTTDWLPAGSGPTTGCGGVACLAPALTAGAALSPPATIFLMEVGGNDANTSTLRSAANILTNVSTIANYVLTQGYARVILFDSQYIYSGAYSGTWNNQSSGILSDYHALLPTLANGTTIFYANGNGGNIYTWSMNNYLSSTLMNSDHVHPTVTGDWVIAGGIMCAVTNIIDSGSCSLVGGSGSGKNNIIGRLERPLVPLKQKEFDKLVHQVVNSNRVLAVAR